MDSKSKQTVTSLGHQDGVILVLALVIMAVLLSTAIGFGVLIISDIRQANKIDDAVTAYYGADSGLEQSLFWLRQDNDASAVDDVATLKLNASSGFLAESRTSWDIAPSTDYEANYLRQRLYNGQSVKLYFLGRANGGANAAKSLQVAWAPGEIGAKVQIVFTQLNPQKDAENVVVYNTDNNRVVFNAESDLIFCENFKDEQIAGNTGRLPPYDYVVEIRSLGTSNDDFIENLKVFAYEAENCSGEPDQEGITNITLRSVGTINKSRQEVVAQLPPKDPVSGVLGFVLFSEEDITKGY